MCNDHFGWPDAHVVCKQLGFPRATYYGSYFGVGSGQIWLDDVYCQGNELSLAICSHPGWGIHNCHHGKDISVGCQDGTLLFFSDIIAYCTKESNL